MSTESTSDNIRRNKLITLLLFEAGMRHRELYWQQNVEAQHKLLDDSYEANKDKIKKQDRTKAKDHLQTLKKSYLRGQEKLNETIYKEIEALTANVAPEAVEQFEAMTNAFSDCTNELLKAKSKSDLIYVMKMYNEGFLDEALPLFKNGQTQKKAKSGIISLNDI